MKLVLGAMVTAHPFLMATLTAERAQVIKWPGDFLQRGSQCQRTLPTRRWWVASPETCVLDDSEMELDRP